MTDRRLVAVVIPTRERATQAWNLLGQVQATAGLPLDELLIVFAVDSSDRQLDMYRAYERLSPRGIATAVQPSKGHGRAINYGAAVAYFAHRATTIIKIDDDHMPRTVGWARELADAAGEWGIAYANDGHQGEALPTVCAWGGELYGALRRMVPGALWHLYVDDYWRELGKALGRLTYLPEVLVEHCHPHAGHEVSAADAARYAAIYADQRKLAAEHAWKLFRESTHGLAHDVATVRRAMAAAEVDA